MYIESRAYVSNLRQKLACGSPVLAPRMTYYEWWSRALTPGVHFVEVSDGPGMCADVVAKVGILPSVSCSGLVTRVGHTASGSYARSRR